VFKFILTKFGMSAFYIFILFLLKKKMKELELFSFDENFERIRVVPRSTSLNFNYTINM